MSRLTKISTLSAAVSLALMGLGTAVAADGPIKIGVQAPITGEYAAEGQGIQNGVKLLKPDSGRIVVPPSEAAHLTLEFAER